MKLFSLSLIVSLLLGLNLFHFLLKTSTTVENPNSTIHVVGKEIMFASICLKYLGVSPLLICRQKPGHADE